jgi:hypothetical protein
MNNKFRIGETVVCVNNFLENSILDIKIGKKYIVSDTRIEDNEFFIKIKKENDIYYFAYRFVSLNEYRKNKLNKIFENDI